MLCIFWGVSYGLRKGEANLNFKTILMTTSEDYTRGYSEKQAWKRVNIFVASLNNLSADNLCP